MLCRKASKTGLFPWCPKHRWTLIWLPSYPLQAALSSQRWIFNHLSYAFPRCTLANSFLPESHRYQQNYPKDDTAQSINIWDWKWVPKISRLLQHPSFSLKSLSNCFINCAMHKSQFWPFIHWLFNELILSSKNALLLVVAGWQVWANPSKVIKFVQLSFFGIKQIDFCK